MQIVNTVEDVTRPKYNPANSELTALLLRLGENRSRERQQSESLAESKRQADIADAYRNKELSARQASEERYFNRQTGGDSEAKAEAAARAQAGYASMKQAVKTLEADYNTYTSHIGLITGKLIKAGVTQDQLSAYVDGSAKAPPALETQVRQLQQAIRGQAEAEKEANQVTAQFNNAYGIGVVLGVDRRNGRFALSSPYIPYGGGTQPSGTTSAGGGGASLPAGGGGGGAPAPGASAPGPSSFIGPMQERVSSVSWPRPAGGPSEADSDGSRFGPRLSDLGQVASEYGYPAAAASIPYAVGQSAGNVISKADVDSVARPVGRFFLGSKVVPQGTATPAATRWAVNSGLSSPVGFGGFYSNQMAPMGPEYHPAPTAEEIAAGKRARDARMRAAGYFTNSVGNPWDAATETYPIEQPVNPGYPEGFWPQ